MDRRRQPGAISIVASRNRFEVNQKSRKKRRAERKQRLRAQVCTGTRFHKTGTIFIFLKTKRSDLSNCEQTQTFNLANVRNNSSARVLDPGVRKAVRFG
jgi:hypothetical protein